MNQEQIQIHDSWAMRNVHKETVAIGAISNPVVVGLGSDVRVAGYPGATGTIEIEYTLSSMADIIAGIAKWHSWNAGASAADATEVLSNPIMAVRAKALVAAGDFEVLV